MRAAIVGLGLLLLSVVGWLLLDLRAANTAKLNTGSNSPPMVPQKQSPPQPATATPPTAPTTATTATAPAPTSNLGSNSAQTATRSAQFIPIKEAKTLHDPVGSANPMDMVKQGKTLREWRHEYGLRRRALLEEMFRYQTVVSRADKPGADGEGPSQAQLDEAHAKLDELKQKMRDELDELRKIETSP